MNPDRTTSTRSMWPTLWVKIAHRKKWAWIGIFIGITCTEWKLLFAYYDQSLNIDLYRAMYCRSKSAAFFRLQLSKKTTILFWQWWDLFVNISVKCIVIKLDFLLCNKRLKTVFACVLQCFCGVLVTWNCCLRYHTATLCSATQSGGAETEVCDWLQW